MSRRSIRSIATAARLTSAVVTLGLSVPLSAQTASSWTTATSGTWTNPTHWSTNPNYPNNGTPPGTTYAATIAATGAPYTVDLSGNVAVSSFTLNSPDATFAHGGGTLDAGTVTLSAGTYAASGGGTLRATSVTGPAGIAVSGDFKLDLATLATAVSASAGSNLTLAGNWTNSGAISVTGGTLRLEGTPAASLGNIALTNSTLDIATIVNTAQVNGVALTNSNVRVSAGGVDNTFATIALSPAGPTWTLAGGQIAGGAITSTGGAKLLLAPGTSSGLGSMNLAASVDVPAATTLSLSSGITNSGVITVQNGGTLRLTGAIGAANLGAIHNTSGGSVVIAGALSNAGNILALNAATGPWTLSSTGFIGNGTITGAAPNNLVAVGGTLTGVTVAGDISVGDNTSTPATLTLSSVTLAPGGRFLVNSLPGSLDIGLVVAGASPTLAGTGEFVFNGTGDNGFVRAASAGATLTLSPGITVRTGTRGGIVGGASTGVRNNGLLSAQTAGRSLQVQGTLNNQGTVEARNGSTLSVATPPANLSGTTLTGGTWNVYDASTLALPIATSITNNAASITLSGPISTFAALSALATNAGSLTLTNGRAFTTQAALNHTGTLTLGPAASLTVTGALTNPGTIDIQQSAVLTLRANTPADVRTQLATNHLTSTTPDPTNTRSLGYLQSGSSILVKLTPTGDANLDGAVNADDYALLDRGFATNGQFWWQGDFNYDGSVTPADYILIDHTLLTQSPTLTPLLLSTREAQFGPGYASELAALIPEPTLSSIFYPLSSLLFLRRHRRSHTA